MIIKHSLINNEKEILKEFNIDKASFILRNSVGDFSFFSYPYNISKYNGYFCVLKQNENEWDMIKSIESIEIDKKLICSKKEKNYFLNEYENNNDQNIKTIEKIGLGENLNYSIENYNGKIKIILDTRLIYDFSTEGRIFKIYPIDSENEKLIVIEYTKYSDNSLNYETQKYFTVIKGINQFEEINKWIRKEYEYDIRRNSGPYEIYVFHTINVEVKNEIKLKFGTSNNLNEAIEKVNKDFEFFNFEQYNINNLNEDNLLAYNHSKNSILQSFVLNQRKGIYAGLPWFYQFWTRDEAISLYGNYLSDTRKINELKEILKNLISNISQEGRIPNRIPSSILGSADGVGWVFKRIYNLIKSFDYEELNYIKEKLIDSINRIESNYMDDGLITNKEKETWMDTEHNLDFRKGKRIEIQALHLNMLQLAIILTEGDEKNNFVQKEKSMKEKVRQEFFNNEINKNILADGKDDFTIRPNVFLAYYIYNDFLNNDEWELVFDKCIENLWLDWGGFSTIDKNSFLFCNSHTGQNNISYHRGDSWYFVNNIAAICMNKVNKEKYNYHINKIIEASTNDILKLGAIGELSEISSASNQEAFGCFGQAWSNATFIELINQINK